MWCGGVVKSVNILQSYKQERGCLLHFARLANTLLKDEESARDNDVLVYFILFNKFTVAQNTQSASQTTFL